MYYKKYLWLFLLFIFVQCNVFNCSSAKFREINDKIYNKKGFSDPMKKRLKPEILYTSDKVAGIVAINKKNRLVTINEDGYFSFVEITNAGMVKIDPIIEGFPPVEGAQIFSDHNIVWMQRGRGLYFLDTDTLKTGHCNAAPGMGNSKLGAMYLVDPENKIFYIRILEPFDKYNPCTYYIIFDLNKNEIVFTSPKFRGAMYPFTNDTLLFNTRKHIEKNDTNVPVWQVIDFKMNVLKDNKLIKKMEKLDIEIWPYSRCIHQEKRIILGTSYIKNILTYYSIRWDEKLEDVKIEPIILQKPGGRNMDSAFNFSPNGNWVKSLDKHVENFPPELIIYQTGSGYPQGLSLPIFCGYTKGGNSGAFMEHEEWGDCYVELDYEFPDRLFVYKLNDGSKLRRR